MKNKEILFVTSQSEQFEEGLSYAIYLAGTLNMDLNVLIMGNMSERFNGLIADMPFADAGERPKALFYAEEPDTAFIQMKIKSICDMSGIRSSVHTRLSSSVSVIKDFLGKITVDMVMLSPSLSGNGALLKKLLKESSRPVVTLAQEKGLAAGYAK